MIIVASVSCIYGIGSVETYTSMTFKLEQGQRIDPRAVTERLVANQYTRNDLAFTRGTFRVKGDIIDIFPAHYEDRAWKLSFFGDELESITEFDPSPAGLNKNCPPSRSTPTATTSRPARRSTRPSSRSRRS
ncbi:MAG: hypothetical protein R3C13_03675 [Hyphomonas sp.]